MASDILSVYSAEQLYELMKNKIIADKTGITNFNKGAVLRSILEAVAIVESTTGVDYLQALRIAIKTMLYEGFDFTKKSETNSKGYLRFFRLPLLTIKYTGNELSIKITNDGSSFSIGSYSFDLSIYDTTTKLADEINKLEAFETIILNDEESTEIYHYKDCEITGKKDYLNNSGFDLCTGVEILINENQNFSIDDLYFITNESAVILPGESSSQAVSTSSIGTGEKYNIDSNAINTLEGRGTHNNPISDVYIINDINFSGGADSESENERKERFQLHIQGLAKNTATGIKSEILKIEGVKSVTVREFYPQPGYITIIADDGTGTLSDDLYKTIDKVLKGDPDDITNYPGCILGVMTNIEAPEVFKIEIKIRIKRTEKLSDIEEIKTIAKKALFKYINTLTLGSDVVLNEIIKVVKSSHPAIYDLEITSHDSNILVDDSTLARCTNADITVINI